MANKPLIYYIYNDLVTAVNGIAKKTYLDRPKALAEETTNFIVVDIPDNIRKRFKGDMNFMVGCYGVFHLFVKSKTDGTPNIDTQTRLTDSILNVFPINGIHVTASEPDVLMKGTDGYGYHVTTITYKLRTKFNADKQ